jgi:hypothetical protein
VITADRILDETVAGSVTAVVGRPGAGVSTLLERVCTRATDSARVVSASWERPPATSVALEGVSRPEIVGWTADDLGRCREVLDAGPGAVVAVDYLQLLGDPDDHAAQRLRALAVSRGWRLALGVMAPRELRELETGMPPGLAMRCVGQVLAAVLRHVDRTVVITGGDAGARAASLGVSTSASDRMWQVNWTAQLDDAGSS